MARPVAVVTGRRALLGVATILTSALASSSSAWALCPNCLGQASRLSATLELLGAFLLIPFAVSYVVFRLIRRACRDV
jgi:hypothetical protein